jgi:hypothetical protein
MFIPRHPVVENQFCSYGSADRHLVPLGSAELSLTLVPLFILIPDASQRGAYRYLRWLIRCYTDLAPFGFAMQKVKDWLPSGTPSWVCDAWRFGFQRCYCSAYFIMLLVPSLVPSPFRLALLTLVSGTLFIIPLLYWWRFNNSYYSISRY